MYPTAPFHTFFLLAFTILFLACSSVVTGTAEDFQIAEGEVLPSGFEYTPLHMTGTIGEIALNHTGTIEEILAQVTTENPGFKVEDDLTVGGPTINTLDNLAKVISTSSTRNWFCASKLTRRPNREPSPISTAGLSMVSRLGDLLSTNKSLKASPI